MSSVSTKSRLFLYLAITVLVVLNCAFLLRDYQKEQDRRDLLQRLYRTQVEVRVLKSEKMFGAPFVPEFRTVDLEGEPAALPNFGKGPLLILFFQPWHCGACLEAMSSFEAVIGDNVPSNRRCPGKVARGNYADHGCVRVRIPGVSGRRFPLRFVNFFPLQRINR